MTLALVCAILSPAGAKGSLYWGAGVRARDISICFVGDAYDSSRALLLDRLLPQNSAKGFFVAVPNRDQLLFLPVTREALQAVHLVKIVADKNYRGAPYPISPDVFWIREAVWRRFDIQVRDREVTITPPSEFATVMELLMVEDDAAGGDAS